MNTLSCIVPGSIEKTYPIYIGSGLLRKGAELFDVGRYSRTLVLSDENVAPLFFPQLMSTLPHSTESLILPAGEKTKHLESIQCIWMAMHRAGCDRKSLVINLGGGVIGDMGGFAASTYMRGVDFCNIPTTLLAQVDASVGGKTGVNFDGVKNLIGSFRQPVCVVIDTQTLTTLPRREFLSGYAEVIKHGLIYDRGYFENIVATDTSELDHQKIAALITHSCKIKIAIVEQDVTEQGLRKVLNFGHTVGHAIESLSLNTAHPLLHGEAVMFGMRLEARISYAMHLLSHIDAQYVDTVLGPRCEDLPPQLAPDRLLALMRSDKKNEKGIIKMVLLSAIGQAVYDQEVPEEVIRGVIASYQEKKYTL